MKCPRCQSQNREGVRFCEDCGGRLVTVCPSCGAELVPEKKFCGSCGSPVNPQPVERQAASPQG
ncbi:MAG TPA: zinc-ribbon domain-containing protein, partial [Methylomirabilota bacterium]|nr:zinc-ribbon domain-containing protein [Methylomirabilota bacterium]